MHDSLQLCFLYKENQKYLLGIYNIEDIIFQKNDYLVVSNKYYIFYNYFENIKKTINNDSNIEFFNNLKEYEKIWKI